MAQFRVLHRQLSHARERHGSTAQAQPDLQGRRTGTRLATPIAPAPRPAYVPPTAFPLPGPGHKSRSRWARGANFLGPSLYAGPRNLVRERQCELPWPLLLCGPRNLARECWSDFVGLHRWRPVNLAPSFTLACK